MNLPNNFPAELRQEMKTWDEVVKSPYGHSYYNAKVDWGYKPDNSLRISDHWNFRSKGKYHCETTTECPDNTHWTIARFDGESQKYIVIQSFKKELKSSLDNALEILTFKRQRALANVVAQTSFQKEKIINKIELNILNSYFKTLQKHS